MPCYLFAIPAHWDEISGEPVEDLAPLIDEIPGYQAMEADEHLHEGCEDLGTKVWNE
jgi:hypothetical protein